MKLHEVLDPRLVNEVSLKQALAAGLLGTAAISTAANVHAPTQTPSTYAPNIIVKHINLVYERLANKIASKYHVDQGFAMKVVELAHKYAHPVFPTAKDILAVVGVESSFNPGATSNLSDDPAVGLMQVRPGKWKLNSQQLLADEEAQIKHGASILHKYFKKLKNKDAAIQAYNIGLNSYRQGFRSPKYLEKVQRELKSHLFVATK